ncbi:MAG: prepilin peptidase [Caldimicrobium sp.]
MFYQELFLVFILGLVFGSFLNVLIYRLPEGKSLLKPSSHCPKCETPLKWYHNIPLISFIFLRGRCAYCGEKISLQYPLVELITALLLVSIFVKFKPLYGFIPFAFFSIFAMILISVFFIDLKHKEIPDLLSFSLIFFGWIFSLTGKNPLGITFKESLLSTFSGIGLLFFINEVYYLITRRDGIGMGDFKLMGGLGAYLGYKSFYNLLFFASLIGVITFFIFQIYQRFFKEKKGSSSENILKKEIPFGPLLSISALIYLFNPKSLL